MDRRLKTWELALMAALLLAVSLGAWTEGERRELDQRVIRLHVVANSDELADQELKLAVRDHVLEAARDLYPPDADVEEARAALAEALPRLEAAGRAEVLSRGVDQPVSARLVRCRFPTREYGPFALPAGEYTALRIVIGEGKGQNWWCVAFPPLCLGAASETVEQAVAAGRFTPGQGKLLAREGGYVLKFKAMELLDRLIG